MFAHSNICSLMDAGVYVPGNPTITVMGVRVPAIVIGDEAYPLRRWLMKPHSIQRTPAQRLFDYRLCRACCVVERAFGRLKARWRRLSVRLEIFFENVNALICACVVLHNICEKKGHTLLQDLEEPDNFILPDNPDPPRNARQAANRHRAEGKLVRDALSEYMYQNWQQGNAAGI